MKIGVVSLFTKDIVEIANVSSQNHSHYCDVNGYNYILYQGRFSYRHPAWDKIKALEKNLPLYDYLLWIDTDAIFKNISNKIESIVEKNNYNGFFGKDPIDSVYVNTGVFILKNCDWSFNLLNSVWNCFNNNLNEEVDKYSYKDWPFEQGPICDFLKKDKNHYIVPNYSLNCHENYINSSTFIIHFMGSRTTEEIYQNTISKIKQLNYKNKINIKEVNMILLPPLEEVKKGNVIQKGEIKVEFKNIQGKISFELTDANFLNFIYHLPDTKHLSHAFKVNDSIYRFDSSSQGSIHVPKKFNLYHSYDWYGEMDWRFIGNFSLP